MFYSHTFLAKKGPLGTVWIASHIEKISKRRCENTDIPSTVDRIMFPEVPLALRLSAYLLYGIVRIYAKKVDYLHSECQLFQKQLNSAFIIADIDLPKNAAQAQYEAVTLPQTYELDAMDLDDYLLDGNQDEHRRDPEDITLVDQAPNDLGNYVAITFDDDIMQDVLQPEIEPDVQARDDPMEVQIATDKDNAPDSSLRLRDADPIDPLIDLPSLLNQAKTPADPRPFSDQLIDDMEARTPATLDSEPFLRPHSEMTSSSRDAALDISGSHISFGNDTLELALRPSPPHEADKATEVAQQRSPANDPNAMNMVHNQSPPHAEEPQVTEVAQQRSPGETNAINQVQNQSPPHAEVPRVRKRRRIYFDNSTVFSNDVMKKQLDERSDLVHKRRKLPGTALEVWRHNNARLGEQMFDKPLISGMCSDLQAVAKAGFISSKPHLLQPREEEPVVEPPASNDIEIDQVQQHAGPDPAPADNQAPRSRSPTHHEEIERLRDPAPHEDLNPLDDAMLQGGMHSQYRGGDQSPVRAVDRIGEVSAPSLMQTPDIGGSRQDQPAPEVDDIVPGEHTGRLDISPVKIRVEDELAFLEEDGPSPSTSQGTQEHDAMSARTRAVAQYLRRHSSASQDADLPSVDISLNHILEGRSRKVSARMFFETLNLKTYGLIDVHQNKDEPYSDIILKLPSALSKTQLSGSSPS